MTRGGAFHKKPRQATGVEGKGHEVGQELDEFRSERDGTNREQLLQQDRMDAPAAEEHATDEQTQKGDPLPWAPLSPAQIQVQHSCEMSDAGQQKDQPVVKGRSDEIRTQPGPSQDRSRNGMETGDQGPSPCGQKLPEQVGQSQPPAEKSSQAEHEDLEQQQHADDGRDGSGTEPFRSPLDHMEGGLEPMAQEMATG